MANSCMVISWNIHRLSTVNAIDMIQYVGRCLGKGVVMLQEAGRWNHSEFECASGWRLFGNDAASRDVAILVSGSSASWASWWACCYYAVAVFAMDGSSEPRGILDISAHLPDRSQADDD